MHRNRCRYGRTLAYTTLSNLSRQYVSSPIHTYCVGQACSMGSLLLAAGEKGKRHALPNSSIMIHRTSPSFRPVEYRSHVLSSLPTLYGQNHPVARLARLLTLPSTPGRFCA